MFSILCSCLSRSTSPFALPRSFPGGVRPVWFAWKGRQIRIKETTFVWKTWQGSAAILHFSVTDGQGLYEIGYNAESMGWRLIKSEGDWQRSDRR